MTSPPSTPLYAASAPPPPSTLFRGAFNLMINTVITAGLGLGFWVAAARLVSSDDVGRDSALVAAMVTLSTISQLNLANALVRFFPEMRVRAVRAALGAYAVSAAAAVIAGGIFVLLVPTISPELTFLRHDTFIAGSFFIALSLWGVFALQDALLTAMRRTQWVILENATFAVAKLGALVAFAHTDHGVFLAWVIPMVVLIFPVNYLIFRRLVPQHAKLPGRPLSEAASRSRGAFARFLASDYASSAVTQIALAGLPLVALNLFGSTENAYFYMPFTMIVAVDLLFVNAATSLTVESAFDNESLPDLASAAVRRFGMMVLAIVAVLVLGASEILQVFGPAYAQHGTPVLRILACASVFRATMTLHVALARILGRGRRLLLTQLVPFVMLIAGVAIVRGSQGLEGLALAWLFAYAAGAAITLPFIVRVIRGKVRPA